MPHSVVLVVFDSVGVLDASYGRSVTLGKQKESTNTPCIEFRRYPELLSLIRRS